MHTSLNADPEIIEIIDRILDAEGGWVDHPADRGGPTNRGVTLETFAAWRRRDVTVEELRALTEDDARRIYLERYIIRWNLHDLPPGLVRVQTIDNAILSGPRRAIRDLQAVCGVRQDGVLGPVTLGACRAADQVLLNIRLVKHRTLRLAGIVIADPTQLVFLRGWLNRALSFLPA